MKINSFSLILGSEILFIEVPKVSSLYVIFTISYMGTLILVSVHNILTVPLPCLFAEVKLCHDQAGLVLGWVRPFGI